MLITIEDTFGREISPGDIVLVRYPNPRIFYLGIFTFLQELCDFVLTDGDAGWEAFPFASGAISHEVISTLEERPELERWLGRNECKGHYETKRFLAIVETPEPVSKMEKEIVHLERLSNVC